MVAINPPGRWLQAQSFIENPSPINDEWVTLA
jgi:hypothetical protein